MIDKITNDFELKAFIKSLPEEFSVDDILDSINYLCQKEADIDKLYSFYYLVKIVESRIENMSNGVGRMKTLLIDLYADFADTCIAIILRHKEIKHIFYESFNRDRVLLSTLKKCVGKFNDYAFDFEISVVISSIETNLEQL